LTAIIVAIVVMVMLPVGAWAVVSGSNVFVTDATSGVRAHLTSKGELETHLNQALSVTGAVTATQTPPSKEYHAQTYATTVGCVDIAVPPAGYAIVITSVTMDTTTANSYTVMSRFNGADCAGSPSSQATMRLPRFPGRGI
jgi:hypothetical protein